MAATVAAYNRLHNASGVGIVGGTVGSGINSNAVGSNSGLGHSQLARSLERILEEAHYSGELILTNRKLKEFPKTGTKYNLTDTVIADLSRNRFCELPEEITTFVFLETLLLYHNTIRSVPESVKQLTSLTYLDLRSNQLQTLPREICFLPLQVLLISNNRLTALPDELGRMDRLTDLDVSYNQLTALPARIGELRSLRSFSLRSNQLMYLPRELTCLNLISLDVSNNRISSLPLEMRQMSTLVEFNLENNPLTSPPASLCVRGLVHVFKFLETQATKDEKGARAGGNYDGYTTLRRAPRHNSAGNMLDAATISRARNNIDSGYSTSDGIDKRWSHDVPADKSKLDSPIRRPTSTHALSTEFMDASLTSSSSTIVDETISSTSSPVLSKTPVETPAVSPLKRSTDSTATLQQNINYAQSISSSSGSSPDQEVVLLDNQHNGKCSDEKINKSLSNIQTYKEYKEALKQQRNQEISSVYKIKNASQINNDANTEEQMRLNGSTTATSTVATASATLPKSIMKNSNINGHNHNGNAIGEVVIPKKPIQKVVPSRNTELMMMSQATNMQTVTDAQQNGGDCLGYVKPSSPLKMVSNANGGTNVAGVLTNSNNNKFATGGVSVGSALKSPVGTTNKLTGVKPHRTVTWNHDIPAEKLSFTMRREFDRQREETELMTQLRSIIESRLKMTLPENMASALTDGVILCHLANYVRPRSVASIHVPSPGVSKLTMARCRRNVDNFLEACRRIGVDEELICSCADVVPPIEENAGDSDLELKNDINSNKCTRNLPNPLAVLQTVAALIALDTNPHHQSICYLQQEHELQLKLRQHRQQQQQQRQQSINANLNEEQQQNCLHDQFNGDYKVDAHTFEQEQSTEPTCTKQQQMMQQQQQLHHKQQEQENNYEIVTKMEFENTSDHFHSKTYFENIITTTSGVNNKTKFDVNEQQDMIAAADAAAAVSDVEEKNELNNKSSNNVIHTAKLKTFQKIKLNLLTSHGHHNFNSKNRACETATTTLHTIVESEHDVVAAGPAGRYQLINEKTLATGLLSDHDKNKSTTAQEDAKEQQQQYQSSKALEDQQKQQQLFAKRIEFFEHNKTGTKPKALAAKPNPSGIFSIYRINGGTPLAGEDKKLVQQQQQQQQQQEQLTASSLLNNMATKSKVQDSANDKTLLRHDSHVLTIILSCIFIITFLLLIFFPLPS